MTIVTTTTTTTRLVALATLALAATSSAFAAASDGSAAAAGRTPSEAQSRQQTRMASCNRDAVGQKGAERKAFMKQCLSGAAATSKQAPAERSSRARAKSAG